MVASARMKFASKARLSHSLPLNAGPTCMPQYGNILDIECRVLEHQKERYQLTLTKSGSLY